MKSTRLTLNNFSLPFNTHGIDVISSPSDPSTVLIFAINHLPNPSNPSNPPGTSPDPKHPKALSQIELFIHTLNTTFATHIRSIRQPLIRTPNDIYARSPASIFVTNDHHYREGVMRLVEDIAYLPLAPWTDLIHLEMQDPNNAAGDPEASILGNTAIKGLHNNNGLGHGPQSPSSSPSPSEQEILIARAPAGTLVLAHSPAHTSSTLAVHSSIQVPSTIGNPSYFHDPFAAQTGRDASGYVLAGLWRAAAIPGAGGMDPAVVRFVQRTQRDGALENLRKGKGKGRGKGKYETRMLFRDDGATLRSASMAVLVAIDPRENGGGKEAWLFVTGLVVCRVVF
jgi:hypothetical protein